MPQQVRTKPPRDPETAYKRDMDELAERDAIRAGVGKRSEIDPEATAELLDEIDAVLEENAEEFVARFRQRGGE